MFIFQFRLNQFRLMYWEVVNGLELLSWILKDQFLRNQNTTCGACSVMIANLSKQRIISFWYWNVKNMISSVELTYEDIDNFGEVIELMLWFISLWKWKASLRIKLFCYLDLQWRILTWHNQVKRVGRRPSYYIIYKTQSINY